MELPINPHAFRIWVPAFVTWNNRNSGIRRPSTEREVAAHRGIFARPTLAEGNVIAFLRNICPSSDLEDTLRYGRSARISEELRRILTSGSLSGVARRMEDLRLFPEGNGRCGRTLEMWSRIALRQRLPREWQATKHNDGPGPDFLRPETVTYN